MKWKLQLLDFGFSLHNNEDKSGRLWKVKLEVW